MELIFKNIDEKSELVKALNEYENLWNKDGEKIMEAFEEVGGGKFLVKNIQVVVYEGISKSGYRDKPMMLRASYSIEQKRSMFIHELGHRFIESKTIPKGVDVHEILNPIIYKVWVKAYGEEFAKKAVEFECSLNPRYASAWKKFADTFGSNSV